MLFEKVIRTPCGTLKSAAHTLKAKSQKPKAKSQKLHSKSQATLISSNVYIANVGATPINLLTYFSDFLLWDYAPTRKVILCLHHQNTSFARYTNLSLCRTSKHFVNLYYSLWSRTTSGVHCF